MATQYSTVNALPYPQSSDANNVPTHLANLIAVLDAGSFLTRMSTATRDALTTAQKPAGRVIYNTSTSKVQVYSGSAWIDITSATELAAVQSTVTSQGSSITTLQSSDTSQGSRITTLETTVAGLTAANIPTGMITPYAGTSAPTGWHLCDGTAHGSTALQNITGSANAPDLRDRFIVGAGTSYSRGDTGGAASVTLSTSQMPSHSHGGATAVDSPDHTHSTSGFTVPAGSTLVGSGGTSAFYGNSNSSGTGGASARHTHSISAEGGGASHENRPPYYALVYIVKL